MYVPPCPFIVTIDANGLDWRTLPGRSAGGREHSVRAEEMCATVLHHLVLISECAYQIYEHTIQSFSQRTETFGTPNSDAYMKRFPTYGN